MVQTPIQENNMKLKMTLDVVKTLDKGFNKRVLTEHASDCPVKVISCDNHQEVLVFDVSISRKILTSKAFSSINYFKPGIEHLAKEGESINLISNFYEQSILFKEGKAHDEVKKAFHYLLEDLSDGLQNNKPLIMKYFDKRKKRISSPLIFTNTLIQLCAGLMISKLTSIPLKRVFHALSLRRNVFFSHFHASRHLASNDAFAYLYGASNPPEEYTHEGHKHLLAQSLIIMGIDPLVGEICANIVEGNTENFIGGVDRHCPTSFVSRLCVQPYSIADLEFNPGDICYTSLLPGKNEGCPSGSNNSSSLAFGVGVHTCIGKRLSLVILGIAQEVMHNCFREGFSGQSVISPDGAFLAFRDTE